MKVRNWHLVLLFAIATLVELTALSASASKRTPNNLALAVISSVVYISTLIKLKRTQLVVKKGAEELEKRKAEAQIILKKLNGTSHPRPGVTETSSLDASHAERFFLKSGFSKEKLLLAIGSVLPPPDASETIEKAYQALQEGMSSSSCNQP